MGTSLYSGHNLLPPPSVGLGLSHLRGLPKLGEHQSPCPKTGLLQSGGILCPQQYFEPPPRIFRPCDGPVTVAPKYNTLLNLFLIFFFLFHFSISPEEVKTALITAQPAAATNVTEEGQLHQHSGHQIGHQQLPSPPSGNFTHQTDYDYGFKLTSAATPISASFGGHPIGNTMVDGMMSSAFAAAAAAHQDSLSRMTSMTNSIAPHQGHAAHTAGQILGDFKAIIKVVIKKEMFLIYFNK